MHDTDMAIGELERCVKDLGFPGIQIGSNINERNLDDQALGDFRSSIARADA